MAARSCFSASTLSFISAKNRCTTLRNTLTCHLWKNIFFVLHLNRAFADISWYSALSISLCFSSITDLWVSFNCLCSSCNRLSFSVAAKIWVCILVTKLLCRASTSDSMVSCWSLKLSSRAFLSALLFRPAIFARSSAITAACPSSSSAILSINAWLHVSVSRACALMVSISSCFSSSLYLCSSFSFWIWLVSFDSNKLFCSNNTRRCFSFSSSASIWALVLIRSSSTFFCSNNFSCASACSFKATSCSFLASFIATCALALRPIFSWANSSTLARASSFPLNVASCFCFNRLTSFSKASSCSFFWSFKAPSWRFCHSLACVASTSSCSSRTFSICLARASSCSFLWSPMAPLCRFSRSLPFFSSALLCCSFSIFVCLLSASSWPFLQSSNTLFWCFSHSMSFFLSALSNCSLNCFAHFARLFLWVVSRLPIAPLYRFCHSKSFCVIIAQCFSSNCFISLSTWSWCAFFRSFRVSSRRFFHAISFFLSTLACSSSSCLVWEDNCVSCAPLSSFNVCSRNFSHSLASTCAFACNSLIILSLESILVPWFSASASSFLARFDS